MLKPAFEPICLAYKPGGKRTMQIDECRIVTGDNSMRWESPDGAVTAELVIQDKGRWPANVCHDGSDEVMAAFPDSAGQQSDITGAEPSYKVPFSSRLDDGSAARFFFSAKADASDRWHSRHPTVKPIDLIAWLIKLVTPFDGIFLDPFAGSGTAAAAAILTHRNAILIEREERYVEDIRERLASFRGEASMPVPRRNKTRREPGLLSDIGVE